MIESDEQRERARAAREALVGTTIAGRYVLRGLIGHGGMGAVYEAELMALGKRFAIKFVDPEYATEETVVARFAREAKAMSTVESPHIVTVFDAGTENGRPYLVMELLRGEDLGQRLRKDVRIPVGEAMHIIAQVLKGLARAHGAGIIHRDLKPDNVFLVKGHTDPLFAKIVDFGISKIDRPRASTTPLALTGRGTVLGTPFYMSPEQAQASSDVDVRADLYSVGAILFECLTGRPPHTGESYEQVILSICMRDAPDVRAVDPKLSVEVSKFVARSLARDRNQRFTSAERMLAGLHEVAPEEKTRVPLDPFTPLTMISPGVAVSVKTQIGTPDLVAPISTRAPTSSQPDPTPPPASLSLPMPAPPPQVAPSAMSNMTAGPASIEASRKRSKTLLLTALGALSIGVGVTTALVIGSNKKAVDPEVASATPTAASSTPPTITSALASDAPPPEPVPSATATATVTAAPAAPSSVVPVVAKPHGGAAATTNTTPKPAPKPTSSTTGSAGKLDIQRDLP